MATLWPTPDRVATRAPLSADQPETLAPFPEVPVTVLVIGIDADRLGPASNQAAPNADALLLLCNAAKESRFRCSRSPRSSVFSSLVKRIRAAWLSCGASLPLWPQR